MSESAGLFIASLSSGFVVSSLVEGTSSFRNLALSVCDSRSQEACGAAQTCTRLASGPGAGSLPACLPAAQYLLPGLALHLGVKARTTGSVYKNARRLRATCLGNA